ncbi:hypothetical protein [Oleidesulfovibrio sp.]|uniref:hypothetical protein n=1 Tax=Oleidesulfovibrio sp. TaxID=2909707 RepID=UPI003A8606B6
MLKHLLATTDNCQDRELQTPEWHGSNDFYSHAAILKEYAGLPAEMPIKAAIEHSLFCSGFAWQVDYNAQLPCMLTMGTYRFETLRRHTDKLLFSVGPIGQYAPLSATEEDIAATREKLGKTLLVITPKSSHRVDIAMDVAHIMSKVEPVAGYFDSILFCMGWKDVLLGRAEHFAPYGIPVSAGHMYDRPFLSNLRTIFALSDASMSFMRGTHIPYSILFDTPHYMLYHKWKTIAPEEIRKADLLPPSAAVDKITQEHTALFGQFSFDITPIQRKYLKRIAGVGEQRSPEEVKNILLLIEEAYSIWQQTEGISGRNIGLYMLEQYVAQGKSELATLLMDTLKASDWDTPAVVHKLGQTAVQLEDSLLAAQAARRLMELDPSLRPQAMALLQNAAS